MKIKIIQEYFDIKLDKIVKPSEIYQVSKERANELLAKNLIVILEQEIEVSEPVINLEQKIIKRGRKKGV